MPWLRAISASIVISVVADFIDRSLASRTALYGRWLDQRKVRRRRRLQRPPHVMVRRRVVTAVGLLSLSQLIRQWLERSWDKHLSDPAEAAQILAEQADRIAARSYAELCASVRLSALERVVEYWFGPLLRTRVSSSTSYDWESCAPSGRAYRFRATVQLKRPGEPVDICVWLTQEGSPGGLVEHRRLSAPRAR